MDRFDELMLLFLHDVSTIEFQKERKIKIDKKEA
jgi:hypothetical protein